MRLFEGTPFDIPPRCERCGSLEAECQCPAAPPAVKQLPPGKQTARLSVEKRQKGKWVTVVRGLPADGNDLHALLGQLKSACGAGGTVKGDVVEVQGKHLPRITDLLGSLGYKTKS